MAVGFSGEEVFRLQNRQGILVMEYVGGGAGKSLGSMLGDWMVVLLLKMTPRRGTDEAARHVGRERKRSSAPVLEMLRLTARLQDRRPVTRTPQYSQPVWHPPPESWLGRKLSLTCRFRGAVYKFLKLW